MAQHTPLTNGQLIWRLMRLDPEAIVEVYIPDYGDGQETLQFYDVIAGEKEIQLDHEKPEIKTIEGDTTGFPARTKYEPAKPATKLVKVNFGTVRPPVGREMELDLGHGKKVRGQIVGFDQYGNADFVVSGAVDEAKQQAPKPRNYTSADFGRKPGFWFDYETYARDIPTPFSDFFKSRPKK